MSTAPSSAGMSSLGRDDREAILALIYRSAEAADEQRYMDWLELFAEDGEYSVITRQNLEYKGLRLCRDIGRAALHERVAFLMGMTQAPRGRSLHIVSNTRFVGAASTKSSFIIARTADGRHSQLHAAGEYHDAFRCVDGQWVFASRLVIVDSNLLPSAFSDLL